MDPVKVNRFVNTALGICHTVSAYHSDVYIRFV